MDPYLVDFVPSPDHNATVSGVPVVTRYDLQFYVLGEVLPVQVIDIGKPNPEADGKIHVSFVPSWPAAGITYEARVTALGPSGRSDSAPSNQFTFTNACNYVINPDTLSLPAGGGNASVSVQAGLGCTWTPASPASWVTVLTAPTAGPGTLLLFVAPNSTASSRSVTLTIGTRSLTIDQGASSCVSGISTSSVSVPMAGGSGQIGVNAAAGCNWQSSSPVSWATVSPASGSGAANVSYVVAANLSSTSRSTTLSIAGRAVTVTQGAGSCATGVSTTSISAAAGGGTSVVGVTANGECQWRASSPVSWVTVTPSLGQGASNASVVVAANTSIPSRSVTLTIAGRSVTVTQPGQLACSTSLSTAVITAPAAGVSGVIGVTDGQGCKWTASAANDWIFLSTVGGSGNGSVGYTIKRNDQTVTRSSSIVVGGKAVAVTQAAMACAYTATASATSVPSMGASGTVTVGTTAGCGWRAASSADWLTVSVASGQGSATIGYKAAQNTTTAPRSAVLTIAGKSTTVTQAAAPCSFALSRSLFSFGATGGTGSVGVTTTATCAWSAKSNVAWITITNVSATRGNGRVDFKVAALPSDSSVRGGTMVIAGKTVTVTQVR